MDPVTVQVKESLTIWTAWIVLRLLSLGQQRDFKSKGCKAPCCIPDLPPNKNINSSVFVPVQMKNLDSPTLNSTLFKDMDTCSAAVMEKGGRKREKKRISCYSLKNTKGFSSFC